MGEWANGREALKALDAKGAKGNIHALQAPHGKFALFQPQGGGRL